MPVAPSSPKGLPLTKIPGEDVAVIRADDRLSVAVVGNDPFVERHATRRRRVARISRQDGNRSVRHAAKAQDALLPDVAIHIANRYCVSRVPLIVSALICAKLPGSAG